MLKQIDPVVENSPVPTGNFEVFPSPKKSFLAVSPNKSYHNSDPLRPVVCGIFTLADRAGDYSHDDKGGHGDA